MKVSQLSRKHPFFTSLSAFILGAVLILGIQKVFADTTTIYACVKTSNGDIRIVPVNTICASNETFLSWNQQGPQGIQGPPGPTGVPGPAGSSTPFGVYVCVTCNFTNAGNVLVGNLLKGKDYSNAFIPLSSFSNENIGGPMPDVSGSTFIGSNLERARFVDSNISASNFSNANMKGISMSGALATNANFSRADLSTYHDPTQPPGGNDRRSDLTNVDFTNSNFNGTNLQGALNMSTANVTGVIWSNTTCPDGTNSDNNSNTCVGHF